MRPLTSLMPQPPVLAMLTVLALLATPGAAEAEVLVRWDEDRVPPQQALGISTLVIPAARTQAVRSALGQGYRVYLEVDASEAGTFKGLAGTAGVIVKGAIAPAQLARLAPLAGGPGASVRVAEVRGKWPHIRTNWVTRNKDVLQVTNRSAQPWLENNEALVRLAEDRSASTRAPVLLTYTWQPVTVSDLDQGPRLEHYLVAIAEAGSFGADLVLPLHPRFEQALLTGRPEARADWEEIRQFLDFYAWNVPITHQPIANVGVVTADPMRAFEVLNLLARHNLPFATMAPGTIAGHQLTGLDLVIVLEDLDQAGLQRLTGFAAGGGAVLVAGTSAVAPGAPATAPWRSGATPVNGEGRVSFAVGKGQVIERQKPPVDPNTFALEMRQLLGRDRRVVDIWNGITVLVAPYAAPAGNGMLLTAVNYAAQPLPIQIRVQGTFSEIQYEAPGHRASLLPFEHREGGTEFVLPALRVGARIFLTRVP